MREGSHLAVLGMPARRSTSAPQATQAAGEDEREGEGEGVREGEGEGISLFCLLFPIPKLYFFFMSQNFIISLSPYPTT